MSDQNNQEANFSWIEFYEELANKLLEYKDKRPELLAKLENILKSVKGKEIQNNKVDSKDLIDTFCAYIGGSSDIDPFTIFAIFNRGQTIKTKQKYFEAFNKSFCMATSIPVATDGVPVVNNLNAKFFVDRAVTQENINTLWELFEVAIKLPAESSNEDKFFTDLFDKAEKIKNVRWNLTFALYWIRPKFFLPLDSNSRNFISINPNGIVKKEVSDYFSSSTYEVPSGEKYLSFCRNLSSNSSNSDFSVPELSHRAYLLAQENLNVWKVSLGPSFVKNNFDQYVSERILSVGKDIDNTKKLGKKSFKDLKKGDIFYLCNGTEQIALLGRVISDKWVNDPYNPKSQIRKFEVLKNSIRKSKWEGGQDKWQPKGNSTVWYISSDNYAEFEETILCPFFNLSIDDLMEMSKKPIGYYEKLEMNNLESKIISQLKLSKNIILHGAPGTGKTYIATKRVPLLMDAETIDFVQFHPSYDYTDFVEGLRPVSKVDGTNSTVCFERKNGTFYSFCENALKAFEADAKQDKKRKFIFIIDEINRGELSKIFGELFFCIDPGYRGVAGAIKTQYENLHQEESEFDKYLHELDKQHEIEEENLDSLDPSYKNHDGNGWFFVPENVYIIGTMNDVDRSVESMDIAFRRRFSFIEIKADDTQYMLDKCDEKKVNSTDWNSILDSVKDKMNALNKAILDEAHLSRDYQIGASYFMKLQDLQDDGTEDKFDLLWKYHLEGLLKEYLRGEPNAEKVIDKLKDAYDLKTK